MGEAALQGAAQVKPRSEWSLAWGRLYRNKGALVGGAVLIVMASGAIFADVIASERLDYYNVPGALLPPGTDGHLFGTDDIGRDVFSRVVRGARISLRIGFTAVAIGAVGGSILGIGRGLLRPLAGHADQPRAGRHAGVSQPAAGHHHRGGGWDPA